MRTISPPGCSPHCLIVMLSKTAPHLEWWAADAAAVQCGILVGVREAKAEEGKLVIRRKHGATFLGVAPDGAAGSVRRSFMVASAAAHLARSGRSPRSQQTSISPHNSGQLGAVVQHNKALKAFASLTGTLRRYELTQEKRTP